MVIYKKEIQNINIISKVICDKCYHVLEDEMEIDECLSLRFKAGYGSKFGDGNNVKVDLCDDCLFELINSYCRCEKEISTWK